MTKRSQTLRALVTERLTAAAEEIFELVERTIAEYEEELCRSKEENQRQKQQEQVLLHGFQINLPTQDDAEPSRSQEIPETPLIKEEPEEQSVKQEEEQLPQVTETSPKTENIVITKVSSLCDVSEKQNHVEAGNLRSHTTTRTQTTDTSAQMETEADGDRYNQVQIKDTSPAAHESSLFSKYKPEPETRAGGKHECPFCTKSFMTKQKLETHVRVHTGQRPFSCSICAKTFARKDHVDVHMRTHTGERAHSCSEAPSGGSSSAPGPTVKFNVQYRGKKTHMNLNGLSYSTFLTEEESITALPAENQSTKDSTETPRTRTESAGTTAEALRIPGARARKRKCKTSRTESDFQNYMEEIQQRIEESHESEQRQDHMFKELMQAQLDAEEKRFRESQEMFTQLLGSIASLRPDQPSSSHHWARPLPAPPSGTGSTPHQHQHHQQHQQQHQHQHQPDSLNPPNQQNPQHHRPEGSTGTSSHDLSHMT